MRSTKQSPRAWWDYIASGRSPGIPEGAVWDRLTHCHSIHRHGTHTVGLGIVFKVYCLFCITRSPRVGYGPSPCTDGLGWKRVAFCIYHFIMSSLFLMSLFTWLEFLPSTSRSSPDVVLFRIHLFNSQFSMLVPVNLIQMKQMVLIASYVL